MDLRCERRVLDNGLSVLVHEDHACPIVAVNLWYHVGSKNEQPGRTGLAHLFEHLMFEGSAHHDTGYFQPLQAAGAVLNGSTNADRTNYWEVVPTGAVELALWLESDRMGYLLPALTDAKFANQRDVVLNERRQNYENRPYGRAAMAMLAGLYPPDHPYHWLTIGSADDLRATTLEEVKAFFATHYHPGNASLAIAGAIEPARAFALAEHYFAEIPAGPARRAVTPPVFVPASSRLVLEDRVELPRLYLAWHGPRCSRPAMPRSTWWPTCWATARRRASTSRWSTSADWPRKSRPSSSRASWPVSSRLSRPRHPGTPSTNSRASSSTRSPACADEGPTAEELARVQAQAEAQFVYRLQTVGGFGGKSDQLNAYNVFVGDPAFFARDLARYLAVTPAAVAAATAQYLQSAGRVSVSVVPSGRLSLALADSEPAVVH